MTVVLQNETCDSLESVCDLENVLHRVLPPHDDESYYCLRFIDWYGGTVFNYIQMEPLLNELKRVSANINSKDEKRLLAQIADLAQRCRAERHLYLKFIGD